MTLKKMSDPSCSKSETTEDSIDTNLKLESDCKYPKRNRLDDVLGFALGDMMSFTKFCKLMFRPEDPSSIAVARVLFGLLMMVDILEERGLSRADEKWGDPHSCHFPLLHFLKPLPLEWMCLLYLLMWFGALGMMLGAYFRLSCICFCLPYWYLFLLDKSAWNNHSYLYGLISLIFLFSSANHCWSVDGLMGRAPKNGDVPLWNYALLRFQVFILYFIAGLKKLDQDWLSGYSMTNLSSHWMFDPFKVILSQEQIDYWIVHFVGFVLDLTIGFWMYFDKTRPLAFIFLSAFHIMNSRLFQIARIKINAYIRVWINQTTITRSLISCGGMFPYVCLATMPLFCHNNWPRTLLKSTFNENLEKVDVCIYPLESGDTNKNNVKWWHKLTCSLLISHVVLQGFLPYSHFLTQGYNNWTNGLYGYSWDMMVHSWDTILIVVKVVDKDTGQEHFLDPRAWTHTDKYSKHGDMMFQYAHCLRDNILREHPSVKNLEIYMDVWCSLNRRFQQRMWDPRLDLLKLEWSPLKPVSWLMPLLTQLSSWRLNITKLEQQVFSWSNYTDALFVADFPGLYLENFIPKGLTNVSLTVLEGEVKVEIKYKPNHTLNVGESMSIPTAKFHKIHTVSSSPACYMYTYVNKTLLKSNLTKDPKAESDQFTLWVEIRNRWENFIRAANVVGSAFLKVFFSIPIKNQGFTNT